MDIFDYEEEYFDDESRDAVEAKEQIIELAKGLVSNETKKRIEDLEVENKKLKEDIECYENFAGEKARLEANISLLERQVDAQYNKGFKDAQSKRLHELLELEEGYAVSYDWNYIEPKCDKCDENRKIHFFSPSGKELTEECSCAKRTRVFKVADTKVTSWIFNYNDSDKKPSRYYRMPKHYSDGKEIRYEEDDKKIWCYEGFDNPETLISGNNRYDIVNVVFANKEDCQKYVDWLNANWEK